MHRELGQDNRELKLKNARLFKLVICSFFPSLSYFLGLSLGCSCFYCMDDTSTNKPATELLHITALRAKAEGFAAVNLSMQGCSFCLFLN